MVNNKELEDAKLSDELTKAFDDGSVFSASDDDLNRYLKHLCSGYVSNENVRHREMNRCQVINTVKTFRFINSIEKTNKLFTVIIIILTVVTVGLTYFSITQSKESSQQIERLIQSQEQKNKLFVNELIGYVKTQNTAMQSLVKKHDVLLEKLIAISSLSEDVPEKTNTNNASNK